MVKVLVKDPILKTEDVDKGGIPGPWPVVGARHGKATNITIPIEEGDLYHMGKLTFRSSDPDQGLVFKAEAMRHNRRAAVNKPPRMTTARMMAAVPEFSEV